MKTEEKIRQARERILARVQMLSTELAAQKAKLELLHELIAEDPEPVSEKRNGTPTVSRGDTYQESIFGEPIKKYAGWKMTLAITDALRNFTDGVTPTALKNYLVENGVESNSKNLVTSITTALTRHVEKGNVKVGLVGGKKLYFANESKA